MLPGKSYEHILVINFGGQYAHMISRRIRELGVLSIIVPYSTAYEYFTSRRDMIKGIILSGGPLSVKDLGEDLDKYRWIIETDIPVLGICFGHQLIARLLGARIETGHGEYGGTTVLVMETDPLFNGWSDRERVWMSHRDHIVSLPENIKVLAVSENGIVAAFRIIGKPIYGVQFHPEVKHTPKGMRLLENFLEITSIGRNWTPKNNIDRIVSEIRDTVEPGAKAIVAVSGGVDSTVAAVLAQKALGDRLIPVLVDHGLFREGEIEEITTNLESLGLKPLVINARRRFIDRLIGITDCEERRKIIGEEFAKIFEEIAYSDHSIKYLIQGTTYPDIIESGVETGSDRIKTHHNVGGLPRQFRLKIIEPLKHLYKDEVRSLAKILGIPENIIRRHPFPGPGLAVRIIGRFTVEKLEIVRRASKILEEELVESGIYDHVWQAFAVIGDDTWVGVKGDSRSVGRIVILRIVVSDDAMTADWARIPYDVLDRISRRITSEIPEVTMVAYSITTKPPSTIEPC